MGSTCKHHRVTGEEQGGLGGKPKDLDQQKGGLCDGAKLGHCPIGKRQNKNPLG